MIGENLVFKAIFLNVLVFLMSYKFMLPISWYLLDTFLGKSLLLEGILGAVPEDGILAALLFTPQGFNGAGVIGNWSKFRSNSFAHDMAHASTGSANYNHFYSANMGNTIMYNNATSGRRIPLFLDALMFYAQWIRFCLLLLTGFNLCSLTLKTLSRLVTFISWNGSNSASSSNFQVQKDKNVLLTPPNRRRGLQVREEAMEKQQQSIQSSNSFSATTGTSNYRSAGETTPESAFSPPRGNQVFSQSLSPISSAGKRRISNENNLSSPPNNNNAFNSNFLSKSPLFASSAKKTGNSVGNSDSLLSTPPPNFSASSNSPSAIAFLNLKNQHSSPSWKRSMMGSVNSGHQTTSPPPGSFSRPFASAISSSPPPMMSSPNNNNLINMMNNATVPGFGSSSPQYFSGTRSSFSPSSGSSGRILMASGISGGPNANGTSGNNNSQLENATEEQKSSLFNNTFTAVYTDQELWNFFHVRQGQLDSYCDNLREWFTFHLLLPLVNTLDKVEKYFAEEGNGGLNHLNVESSLIDLLSHDPRHMQTSNISNAQPAVVSSLFTTNANVNNNNNNNAQNASPNFVTIMDLVQQLTSTSQPTSNFTASNMLFRNNSVSSNVKFDSEMLKDRFILERYLQISPSAYYASGNGGNFSMFNLNSPSNNNTGSANNVQLDAFERRKLIIQRIRKLSQGRCIPSFKWKNSASSSWNETISPLPSDSIILFHLFCTFLDLQFNPSATAFMNLNGTTNGSNNPLSSASTGSSSNGTDAFFFSSNLTNVPWESSSGGHRKRASLISANIPIIKLFHLDPPHFQLYLPAGHSSYLPSTNASSATSTGSGGHQSSSPSHGSSTAPIVFDIQAGRNNFWYSLIGFLLLLEQQSGGFIGPIDFGGASINLFSIFGRE